MLRNRRFRSRLLLAASLLMAGVSSAALAQDPPELYARHRGSGKYELRGSSDSWALSEARVHISRAGDAEIQILGRSLDLVMRGRATGWSTKRQIGIQLEQFDGKPTNVKGWVRVDERGGFERIELDGQSPGRIGISFHSSGRNLEVAPPRPPVVAPPSGRWELTEEVGYDRRGLDYRTFGADSLADCTSACIADPECRAYAYSRINRTCGLKSADPGRNVNQTMTSGVKQPVGYQSQFRVREGFDQLGNDFASYRLADANACEEVCAGNPHCRAFTYVYSSGVCYLKDRTNLFRPSSGRVTGARVD